MTPDPRDSAAPTATPTVSGTESRPISWLDWLRYGPFLAQVIVTRRCNLTCGYCTEYDRTSAPVPFDTLQHRLERLRDLRTWVVSLMGGEPTLHPDLLRIVSTMHALGFRRRMMTTNGLLLTEELVEGLNDTGLTHLNLSIDGVKRNATTVKVLDTLGRKLDLLAERARFEVTVSAVIGSAPGDEVIQVAEYAQSRGFWPRLALLHDADGQIGLSAEDRAVYADLKRVLGRRATRYDVARPGELLAEQARDYRERLIRDGEAPFRCRSGARYLYIDEFGMVRWCAQTRASFGKNLSDYTLEDLRQQFYSGKPCSATCCVGCVRTVSALDQWRSQRPAAGLGMSSH